MSKAREHLRDKLHAEGCTHEHAKLLHDNNVCLEGATLRSMALLTFGHVEGAQTIGERDSLLERHQEWHRRYRLHIQSGRRWVNA